MNIGTDEKIIKRYQTKEQAEEKIGLKFRPINFSVEKEEKDFMNSLKGNYKDLSKLKKLYTYADLVNTSIDEITVCQKGCSHCCKIPVDVSELEIKYIERNTEYKRQNIEKINTNDYCPFLNQDKGICSIYQFRPLVCRTFFTFDNPKYCENKDEKHVVITLEGNQKLSGMYNLLLLNTNNMSKKDIRYYFK
ncbi:YkgJ family cysteine cluster protein [Arcobacter ellisii]|uniref:Zinc/iron-chelating domain-containing protein n=1 Tax=Arcobacter ellisii TaxID=913109 RepID=A0A347UA14_9BACT|nr:YkgJ family cysteine cluster protein [Arcobacter ellisii]AXX95692.1 zinc/iron-chelating domain-containing protein [Arcobacter ellisii]RXI31435.1 zinc/iron-chelating domain-containing protein [Arcobacter ellisii]